MEPTYRAEKDGLSFSIQPFMLGTYAEQGYSIYKTVEVEVTDVALEEAQAMQSVEASGIVEGEVVTHG